MTQSLNKTIIAGCFGNALEWYDFALYGYLAATLGELFFPSSDPQSSLLLTFSAFAIGLFMRPIGGLLLGFIGDRMGRKTALVISILAITVPTTLIGCLPTHATWGVWASILLVILRMLQGLTVGGELIGAIIFLTEHAKSSRRGFISSFVYLSGTLGGIMGSLCGILISLLSHKTLLAWGWRIPFLVALPLGLIGLYVRETIGETPPFKALKAQGNIAKKPLREALSNHYKEIIKIFGLIIFQAVGFYSLLLYTVTWLTVDLGLSLRQATTINFIITFVFGITIPFFGHLSDKWGQKQIMGISLVVMIIAVYPLLYLTRQNALTGSFIQALWPLMIIAVILAGFHGPLSALLVHIASLKNRYTTLAIGYNFSAAIFGGTAPLVATSLIATTKNDLAPSAYVIGTAIVALLTLPFITSDKSNT